MCLKLTLDTFGELFNKKNMYLLIELNLMYFHHILIFTQWQERHICTFEAWETTLILNILVPLARLNTCFFISYSPEPIFHSHRRDASAPWHGHFSWKWTLATWRRRYPFGQMACTHDYYLLRLTQFGQDTLLTLPNTNVSGCWAGGCRGSLS